MRKLSGWGILLQPAACALSFLIAVGPWNRIYSHAEEAETGPHSPREVSSVLPQPVTEESFAALKANSPFLRRLDFSKSLVLTGIAEINGRLIATLHDRETEKTTIVSDTVNHKGWRLVGVDGDQTKLETMTARISVAGREVVSVGFEKSQLSPAPGRPGSIPPVPREQAQRIAEQARNFRRGISGDGHRGPPPPELVEKLSKLNEDMRGRLIYQISEMRNRGVSSEKRQKAFVEMVDGALQGRR